MKKIWWVVFSLAFVFLPILFFVGCSTTAVQRTAESVSMSRPENEDTPVDQRVQVPRPDSSEIAGAKSAELSVKPSDIPHVVAKVNGVEILSESFDSECERIEQQYAMQGISFEGANAAQLKKTALKGLIDRELLIQEYGKQGIRANRELVQEQLADIKKQFASTDEYNLALQSQGYTEERLVTEIEQSIGIQTLLNDKILNKATVSEAESRQYYDANPDVFKQEEEVRASHILIMVEPDATEVQKQMALKKIQELKQRVDSGEEFALVAAKESQCPSSGNGGDLGFFKRGQMVHAFEEAAFALDVGQVSDIVTTEFGYHIIKVTGKRPAGIIPYEEIRAQLEEYMKQEKAVKEYNIYMEGLSSAAVIERFVTFE